MADTFELEDQLCNKALNAFDGKREVIAVKLSNGQEFLGVAEAPGMRAERSLNYALQAGRTFAEGEPCPTQQLRVTVKPGADKTQPSVTFTHAPSLSL